MGCEALGDGEVDAALIDVGDGDGGAAGLSRHGGREQTDGAGADDQGSGAGSGLCAVHGVDGDG